MRQIAFAAGGAPEPVGGAHSAPRLPVGFEGRGEGKERERKRRGEQ